ncbi:unnamed protein product [Parascedosporium putredinis]|uniref:Ribosomal protein/NADH dehydrogenase domain-containing protein n=1 Tax=Parascedosporium putredinis TaxID=1442378 RepID=A0A9P1M8N4_9PEZI|nr:unnamed protein product [Parascedosporium putredinis]CAI7990451.1 unnamed protein product [Parascedosporium putredinis]
MTGVASRWNKLHRILNLRVGPGAAVLPNTITRIHLEFASKAGAGHVGPRKFWQDCVRRLKYHNPAVPMIINRTTSADGPAKMTLYFKKPDAQTPADAPARVVELDIKGKRSDAILDVFMRETSAEPVAPTPEEEEAFAQFEKLDKLADYDRTRMKKMLDEERKAKAMLRRAKAGASA